MENLNRCLKCGKKFKESELKYKINIMVSSTFDGILNEKDEDLELDAIVNEIKKREPEELEDEVYKEINFVLCKPCRDFFVKDLTDLQIKQIIEDKDLTWQ